MSKEKENITVYQPKKLEKAKELFEKFKQMELENLDEEKFFFLFEKGNGEVGLIQLHHFLFQIERKISLHLNFQVPSV